MDIFSYLDYRQFLKDAYLDKKSKHRYFTHAYISQKAELKSTGFFSWVLNGKRNISPRLIIKFSKIFGLNRREAAFFELLVHYNQAKTHEEKSHYFEKIITRKKFKSKLVSPEQYTYFKHWFIPAIRELIAIQPIRDDAKVLSKCLIPSISPAEVREAVEILEKLGFIYKDESGFYKHHQQTISTGENWRSVAITNYQTAMMELGIEAQKNLSVDERDISSITVTCSEEIFESFRERVRELRREFLETAKADEKPEKVYQCNFQLFPVAVSKKPEEGEGNGD